MNFESFANEDGFSVIPLDGFSNWDRLLDVGWIFKNAFGEPVNCYVILDRDYYASDEIDNIIAKLEHKGVKIYIWSRKEIENYLINFESLYRLFSFKLSKRFKGDELTSSKPKFIDEILSIIEGFKVEVQAKMIPRRIECRPDRKIDPTTITADVLEEFQNKWADLEYRKNVIPGKDFFAKLNAWLNDKYHITIPVD